jgi:chromosome segregation ATPase
MTAKERRIKELRKLISSEEDDLDLKDTSITSIKNKTSELENDIENLNSEIESLETTRDEKGEDLEALTDLIGLKEELDKLDPPYTPAKLKTRPEPNLWSFPHAS